MYEIIAYTGSALSILLFVGLFFGLVDLDLEGADLDSDSAFKVFSLQNIAYFAMVGGWVGVWSSKRGDMELWTLIFFIVGGTAAVMLSQTILTLAKKLNHTTKVDYKGAIGKEGKVTVSISPGSAGKVQTIVSGKLVELTARYHQDDKFVPTGSLVRIQNITNNNELIVA